MFDNLFGKKSEAPATKRVQKMMRGSSALGLSVTSEWNNYRDRVGLEEGYEGNSWVYACVRKKQQAAGSVPYVVQKSTSEGWEADEESTLLKLLQNPCPSMSGSQLLQAITAQLDIAGAFHARVIRGGRGGNVPLEIWPLEIGSVSPRFRGSELVGWKHEPFGLPAQNLELNEIMCLRHTHPDGVYKGMSAVRAGGKAIDIDNDASDWQKVTMQNRGIPDGVFTLEGEVGVDEWEEARRQVRDQYTGLSSAREPWVLANASFSQMSQSMADLDFMEGRKMTRSEICSVLDVPEPLIGIYENATLSNIETARKIFWRDTLVPLLTDISDQMTRFFTGGKGVRIRFDFTSVSALQDSLQEKMSVAKDLFSLGVPLSEINRRLEMNLEIDQIPGAEVGYTAGGLVPSTGGGGDGFDRVIQLAQLVAGGELSVEAATTLGKVAMPDMDPGELTTIFESSAVEKSFTDIARKVGYA